MLYMTIYKQLRKDHMIITEVRLVHPRRLKKKYCNNGNSSEATLSQLAIKDSLKALQVRD